MKWKFFNLLLVFACVSALSYAQYKPDTIKVTKTGIAPTIDGEADEVWNNVDFIEIVNWGTDDDTGEPNPTPEDTDFSASFKVLWDDQYIYFLGELIDDIVMDQAAITSTGAPDWETDNFEIYWAPTNTQLDNMTEMMQVRTAFANSTQEDASAPVKNGWSEGGFTMPDFVTAARISTAEGWQVEARFDHTVMAAKVGDGMEFLADSVIGFNTIACDNDESDAREHIGGWIEDGEWNQADTLGVLLLTANAITSLETKSNRSVVSLYPNPASSEINISGDLTLSSVEIINTIGVKVMIVEDTSKAIDVSALQQGMYLVNFYSEGKLLETKSLLIE